MEGTCSRIQTISLLLEVSYCQYYICYSIYRSFVVIKVVMNIITFTVLSQIIEVTNSKIYESINLTPSQ